MRSQGQRRRRIAAGAVITVAATLAIAGVARAQTFTVIDLSDSGAPGSLRGELAAANGNPGADTINFASGLTGTITLSGNGLQVRDPVDIEGPGPSAITIAQSSVERVVHVNLTAPGAVTIAGLHLANGTAPSGSHGGDIYNDPTNAVADLTVANSLVTGGTAGDYGGGIDSYGAPLTLLGSTVSGNTSSGGGGIWVGDPGFRIEGSTITGNSSSVSGGGMILEIGTGGTGLVADSAVAGNSAVNGGGGATVSVGGTSSVTLRNSTFAGNTTSAGGGAGLFLGSSVPGAITIEDSTVAANHASNSPGPTGGGIESGNTSYSNLQNTIVAGNTNPGLPPDLYGTYRSAFSLIGNPSLATITETVPGSDLIGVDPQLGPLASNGGLTQTMALPPSSPAVDKGAAFGLATDQRGAHRPIDFPAFPNSTAPGADGSDIGAYELQPATGFKLGKLKLRKRKGTAVQIVELPTPDAGSVILSGKGLKSRTEPVPASGILKLKVRAKGKLRRALGRNGKAKASETVTYDATGQTPRALRKKIKLLRRR